MSLNSPNPPSPDAAGPQTVWLYQAQKKIYPRAVTGWVAGWR